MCGPILADEALGPRPLLSTMLKWWCPHRDHRDSLVAPPQSPTPVSQLLAGQLCFSLVRSGLRGHSACTLASPAVASTFLAISAPSGTSGALEACMSKL